MENNKITGFDTIKFLFSEINLTVNTYDIDIAGHVNNIVYIRWLEDLRNKFFAQIHPMEKLLEANHYLFVVSSDVKYKKQIKLFDKPIGRMILKDHSHGIFTLKAEINIDNHVAFIATQKCVVVSLIDNKMFKGNIFELVEHL
ncbi:MAG: thioesterase family protein [bacterium]